MFTLYSQRMKDAKGNPEVYIYDDFPTTFRNQFFRIIQKVLSELESVFDLRNITEELCRIFSQEKGLKAIVYHYNNPNSIDALSGYIDECSSEDLLDLIDFIFGILISNKEFLQRYQMLFRYQICEEAIDELNLRLRQHDLGYEFSNRQIIKKTNTVMHENAVKPTLKLLTDEEFRGAEQEYLLAFEHFKKAENKDAVLNAGKAFESTMKIICTGMGYAYDPVRDTAKKLISILKNNTFFPFYLEKHMDGICTTLESGAPTVRNKTAGHGKGTEVKQVTDEYVEYVLNLVASNILFLYRLYQVKKGEAKNAPRSKEKHYPDLERSVERILKR